MAESIAIVNPEPLKSSQKDLVNPLDAGVKNQEAEPDFIKNIVSTELGQGQKIILDEAPELDNSLLQDTQPPKSLLLLILKIFFTILFVTGIASFLFFTSQLSDSLSILTSKLKIPNVSQELALSNDEIITSQTEANLYRYLNINGIFDKFTRDSDSYLQNFEIFSSQTATNEDKAQALNELSDLKISMKENFDELQKLFSTNFTSTLIDEAYADPQALNQIYEEKLLAKFDEKINQLTNETDPQAKRDLKTYLQTKNLVVNTEIKNLVLNMDFAAMNDEELYETIKKINALIVNDLSIIRQIKAQRIKWSDVINEIYLRTKAVDKNFSEDFYNELGGIRYTNYDFESNNKRISIVGETKQFGTENFTMIVDLIDELNNSRMFENAEMRSFSKSGSIDEGYTAVLKLGVNLQEDEKSKQDKDLQIDETPEILETN